jgi:hypothetical protein
MREGQKPLSTPPSLELMVNSTAKEGCRGQGGRVRAWWLWRGCCSSACRCNGVQGRWWWPSHSRVMCPPCHAAAAMQTRDMQCRPVPMPQSLVPFLQRTCGTTSE